MSHMPSRREFMVLGGLAVAATSTTTRASTIKANTDSFSTPTDAKHIVRFGVIADPHVDIAPRGWEGVSSFITSMKEQKADFIMGLGDFCCLKRGSLPPYGKDNADLLKQWKDFGNAYHVLGNHDMDHGASRKDVVKFFGIPDKYYTFDAGPVLGVVLDGNDPDPRPSGGYARAIGKTQQVWMEKVLTEATKPVIFFIHQPFSEGKSASLVNTKDILAILKRHKDKIMAVFSGHMHRDQTWIIDDIAHVTFSSASYVWMNNPKREALKLAPEMRKRFPWTKYMALTRETLWAMIEIDTKRKTISIQGKSSVWEGLSPEQCGQSPDPNKAPYISNRYIELV